MDQKIINQYRKLLNLKDNSEFIHISHQDSMVALIYKVEFPEGKEYILKISDRPHDYYREKYYLQHFSSILSVPKIIKTIEPQNKISGAILMEFLPGHLLDSSDYSEKLAYDIGAFLAIIHNNKTEGFGDLTKPQELTKSPYDYYTRKFNERVDECKGHLKNNLINACLEFYKKKSRLFFELDGPCIIHRDYRPGNIIINHGKLQGIIDWASARSSFAEDDFCSIEHGEWKDFDSYKKSFFSGYSKIRKIPDYKEIMPLLRLNRALAIIGFTSRINTWNTTHKKVYQYNRKFIDELLSK